MSGNVGPYKAVETYVHLGPDGITVPLQVTSTFWEQLTSGAFSHLGPGRLVSTYEFKENWSTWEKHPAGEELVVLLAGTLDFILDGREENVLLTTPGQFLIVPRDTWHTANVAQRALALFVTPGEGTEHRPRT
jgi:mannose-6-phosphate isomerase-like protein (cupin superfamily)